jgi:hypothetical protein
MYRVRAQDRGQTIDALARFKLQCRFNYNNRWTQRSQETWVKYERITAEKRKNWVIRPDLETSLEVGPEAFDALVMIRTPMTLRRS